MLLEKVVAGSMEMIAAIGEPQGLVAHAIDLQLADGQDDQIISSSRIRSLITEGNVKEAAVY